MIEVEVKARAPKDAMRRILAMGSVPAGVEHHRDLYFNHPLPERDFREMDEAIRIRVKEQGVFLTYKGPKLDLQTKTRKELTVHVDDPGRMEEILIALGFRKVAEVSKVRSKYSLGDSGEITIALDEVVGLGSFVEVEIAGGRDLDRDRRKVLDMLHRLGAGQPIRESYLELLLEGQDFIRTASSE